MNKTGIQYLTHTWNPIKMRCTPVSESCERCWHLHYADRMKENKRLPQAVRDAYAGGPPVLDEKELDAPMRRKEPGVIGVMFMGDLFHESIGHDLFCAVWTQMVMVERHMFLLLTKRLQRMAESVADWINHMRAGSREPVKNIWLGVTVENQTRADERIPILLQIPAAKRFVSIEPMLGPVDLRRAFGSEGPRQTFIEQLDWVVVGGETGPGARPMHPDWARSLRDQCRAAKVPFWFKSWGEWAPCQLPWESDEEAVAQASGMPPWTWNGFNYAMVRVGHNRAGNLLDGRTHEEMPALIARMPQDETSGA